MEVDARNRWLLIPNSNIDTERQGITIAELKGYQMSRFCILEGSMCSRNVVCNGVSRDGERLVRKIFFFFFFGDLRGSLLNYMGIVGTFCGEIPTVDHYRRFNIV